MSGGDSGTDWDFAELDALLDQALTLDDSELAGFLAGLEPSRRAALLKLLSHGEADALSPVAAWVNDALPQVAQSSTAEEQTAGSWHLKHEIGSGGTGQVFYAERQADCGAGEDSEEGRTGFSQRAAVKVLWSHRVTSQFKQRFYRERRILASIDHPGLARLLDGGLLGDGRPWFAMEFVDGVDIVRYAAGRPLTERLNLFLAVCDTLEYAHQRLIVHRDIKPQNVLVDSSGRPRLLDFGIARLLGDATEDGLTRPDGTPLTLQYASPEQVTGKVADVASDVYQLGLLLYRMLAGRDAYDIAECSLQAAVRTICDRIPPPPSTHAAGISRDLDAVVGRALHKSPSRRYASAAALADDLRRYLEGRPVLARPHSAWYVSARFVQRHALLVGVIACSVLALAGATVFSINMALEAQAEAERSRKTQQILADVFQQADPFGDGGADVSLASALITAKPSIEEVIAGDPRLAWEVNKTLADIYTSLSLVELEREAYEAAWEAARQLGGDNEAELLLAIAGIGNTLARTNPGEAAAFFAEHLPGRPSSRRTALDWLSAKYAEVGAWNRLRDYARADQGARDMAEVARAFDVEAPRTLGRINQLLAGAARRAGDIPAADAHWAQAVEYMRLAEEPHGHAVTLSNMALHFGMTGRYSEADTAFREAIEVFRRVVPNDPSHADVLRLYAGLLFRMERPDEALRTLQDAIGILDPAKQGYAYFVAQLNYAQFAFVTGDVEAAFGAIDRGLEVALPEFGPESAVTRRMFAVLGRLLLFADQGRAAGVLMGLDDGLLCGPDAARTDAVLEAAREMADTPAVDASREEIFLAIGTALEKPHEGAMGAAAFESALAAYRDHQNVFFDPLDQWQFLDALRAVAGTAGGSLPDDLASRLEELGESRTRARDLLQDGHADALRALLRAVQPDRARVLMSSCTDTA